MVPYRICLLHLLIHVASKRKQTVRANLTVTQGTYLRSHNLIDQVIHFCFILKYSPLGLNELTIKYITRFTASNFGYASVISHFYNYFSIDFKQIICCFFNRFPKRRMLFLYVSYLKLIYGPKYFL